MAEVALNKPKTAKAKPKRKKKHILRKLLITLIVLALAAAGGFYAYSSLRAEYTVTYTGYTATTGSISNALSFSGSLALIDSKTYTADSDATVRAVFVAAGDDVKEGDRLLRLSTGSIIKADFDGRVNTLNVEEGDSVSSGDTLVQIADFSHMKVSIRVDEYDIGSVSLGQSCRVTATATEREFESTIATIDYISASAGNVAYYTATAYVDVDEGIYPGMQATVTVPQDEANDVVVLNMNALSFDENNSAYVYMMDDAGEMTQVHVEVGVSNGSYVEIRSGLSDGDEVYVETQIQTASAASGLLSGIFGGQQIMPGGMGQGRGNMGNRDFSNFDFSNLPNGGNMPGGNVGGGNMGGGAGGGFGGGRP